MKQLATICIALFLLACSETEYCAECRTINGVRDGGPWMNTDTSFTNNCGEKLDVSDWIQMEIANGFENDSVRRVVNCTQDREEL